MRRLAVLVAVLVVLVAGWGVQRWQQRRIVTTQPARTLDVQAERVTRLRIERHGEPPVQIERVAGSWRITAPGDYRASEPVVSGALKALDSLALVDVVSNNPAKRSTFQVDSTGTRLQVQEGDKNVLDLVVGKASPDFSHTYVRPEGSDEVFRADGMLTYQFNKRLDDWRDKTILDLDAAGIVRVVLEAPKEKSQLELVKSDSTWALRVAGGLPEAADSLAVAQVLRTAAKLMSSGFVTPEAAAGVNFGTPDFRLQVDTDSGSHTVVFVEAAEGKMDVQHVGDAQVYQTYKSSVAGLMKKADELRRKKA